MPDLTPTQKATLRFLRHRVVSTSAELAKRAGLPGDTARSRLEALVRLGLAKKVPSNDAPRPTFYWYEIKEIP